MTEKVKFPVKDAFYKLNADNKLELHLPGKTAYQQLSDDIKTDIKRGFIWGRQRGAWVSRSKGGFVPYSMKKYEIEYKGADDVNSFEDMQNRKVARAENKAKRYEGYAANADKRAESLKSDFNRLRKDWSWLTQPITPGAGGRRFANHKNKVMARYDNGMRESIKADNMREYAESLKISASQRELKDPYYLKLRIKENTKIVKSWPAFEAKYADMVNDPDTPTDTRIWIDGRMQAYKLAFDKLKFYNHHLDLLKDRDGDSVVFIDNKEKTAFVKKYLPAYLKEKHGITIKSFTKAYEVKSGVYYFLRTDKDLPAYLSSNYASKNTTQLSIDFLYQLLKVKFDTSKVDPSKYKQKADWNKQRLIDEKVTHIYMRFGMNEFYLPIQRLERGSAIVGMWWNDDYKPEKGIRTEKIPYGRIKHVKTLSDNYTHKTRGHEMPVADEYLKLIKAKAKTKPAKKTEKKLTVKKFEVGKKYTAQFIGDADLKPVFEVLKRTDKTLTVKGENEKESVTKKIEVWNDTEKIYPYGKYSMAPALSADKEVKETPAKPTTTPPKLKKFSDVKNIAREKIAVVPDLFQGRQTEYSEDTVNKIVNEGYDKTDEPIVVWWSDEKNKYVVISGHSRWEASKRLYKAGDTSLSKMPVKVFLGDEDEAINYAVLESNRAGTAEGIKSDIAAYKKAITAGYNRKKLSGLFKPESYLNQIQLLSYLNPDGRFLENIGSSSEKSFPYLRRNAEWVGTLRKQYPAITNSHETEMFKYLYNKDGLRVAKQKFFDLVQKKVQSFFFDASKPLNLSNVVSTNAVTDPGRQKVKEIEQEIEKLNRERVRKEETLARAKREGITAAVEKLERDLKGINRVIREKVERKQQLESQLNTIERSTGFDLFSQPAPSPQKKTETEQTKKVITKNLESPRAKRVFTKKEREALKRNVELTIDQLDKVKHPKHDELLKIAHKINSMRSLTSQIIDGRSIHKKRLPVTPENLKMWARNPGKYDLIGVDAPANVKATAGLRSLKKYAEKAKIMNLYKISK